MKKVIFLFFVSLCFINSKGFSQSSAINIMSYDIKANCDLNKRNIDIKTDVIIKKNINSDSFKLLFGSWIQIKSIKYKNVPVLFTRKSVDDDTLFICIPKEFKDNKELNLTFDYILPLDSLSKNKNLIFLQSTVHWFPFQYNDIASMKLDITAPNNFTVFGIGDLVDKININKEIEYHFKNEQNNHYGLFLIKSDTFTTTLTKRIDNVNINFYFISKDTVTENKIIKEACKSFLFYDKYIGSYKYNQLNLVEMPDARIVSAFSFSTLVVMGSIMINGYKLDYGDWPAHEVAHQWWGNGIFTNNKAKGGLFLEEAIDEYFKAIYIQNEYGEDSLKKQLKSYLTLYGDVDKNKELPIFEVTNFSTMNNGYVIYQKGALVVNKLRNLMGSETYHKFIQEIYKTYFGKMFSYDAFIKVLSEYDTKGNLVSSLNKWLSEKGFEE